MKKIYEVFIHSITDDKDGVAVGKQKSYKKSI